MENNTVQHRIMYPLVMAALLFGCFLLCRFPFFSLHGMKSWPFNLFVPGLVSIIIFAVFNCRKAMLFTVVGYIIGFALGMLFNTARLDSGGGMLNNAWIIWTASFLMLMVIGGVLDLVTKKIGKKS